MSVQAVIDGAAYDVAGITYSFATTAAFSGGVDFTRTASASFDVVLRRRDWKRLYRAFRYRDDVPPREFYAGRLPRSGRRWAWWPR